MKVGVVQIYDTCETRDDARNNGVTFYPNQIKCGVVVQIETFFLDLHTLLQIWYGQAGLDFPVLKLLPLGIKFIP